MEEIVSPQIRVHVRRISEAKIANIVRFYVLSISTRNITCVKVRYSRVLPSQYCQNFSCYCLRPVEIEFQRKHQM